jgi:hypothetical protein
MSRNKALNKPRPAASPEKPDQPAKPAEPAPPTALSTQLVRYVRGFGVGVALGLAPFLGVLPIPGFSALLDMYPESMRGWLIPLSGILMGILAVFVEFLGTRIPPAAILRKWFKMGLAVWAVSFLALLFLYPRWVARVEVGDGSRTPAFVTGSDAVPLRPPTSPCKCPAGQTAEECIADVGLALGPIRECFGSGAVTTATQVLAILYFLLTGGFVFIVGLLLLLQQPAAKAEVAGPAG